MARSTRSVAPYGWGGDCRGWRLVEGGDLTLTEEEMPPHRAEARHAHSRVRQVFYVLSGVLELELAGAVHRLRPGGALEIPPGVPHTARTGEDGARFLVAASGDAAADRRPA